MSSGPVMENGGMGPLFDSSLTGIGSRWLDARRSPPALLVSSRRASAWPRLAVAWNSSREPSAVQDSDRATNSLGAAPALWITPIPGHTQSRSAPVATEKILIIAPVFRRPGGNSDTAS
jgi:hypothetical protein